MPADEKIIKSHLVSSRDKVRFLIYDTVDSTNRICRDAAKNGEDEWLTVISDSQSAGHGRYGRPFFSPADSGLYMSILLRPSLNLTDALLITTAAAVATARAIEDVIKRKCGIKWVNDIFLDGKKVCGILAESGSEGYGIKYSVLGIGLNISEPHGGFPDEIKDTAGTLFDGDISRREHLREELASGIIEYFFGYYEKLTEKSFFKEYEKRMLYMGKSVSVISAGGNYTAKLLSLNDDFSLTVLTSEGDIKRLSSGEVGIRCEGD